MDDLLIRVHSIREAEAVIAELDSMGTNWNLELNKKKSEILIRGPNDEWKHLEEIGGIKISTKVKYLGMSICTCKARMAKAATR